MSTKELQEKISRYHETLLQERELKEQLIKKLQAIREVVSRHRAPPAPRTASKAGGIPFGLGAVAAAFMPVGNAGDNNQTYSDKLLMEVKNILDKN